MANNPNHEIQKNHILKAYIDKRNVLPKPWHGPINILSILYDGDGLESVLKRLFFQIQLFPEIKVERSTANQNQGFQHKKALQMC